MNASENPVKSHRIRRTCSIVLLVIASVLAPLVVTSGWAITTVTNTDRFVATMSALGSNTTITAYVAQKGATEVVTKLDVTSQLQKKLPAQVSFLAPIIASELQTELTKVFTSVLNSPKFQAAWDAKIRFVHADFVKLMTTNPTRLQKASQLAIDYTPQILEAIQQLDDRGITVLDPVRKLVTGNGHHVLITLAQEKQFKQVQWYFNIATKLRWILPALTILLGAAAVLFDTRRRRAGIWLALGISISCLTMLLILAFAKSYAASHAPTPPDVANALFATLTSYLRWELRVAVLAGAATALLLWATGPSQHAVKLRRAIVAGSTSAARKVGSAVGDERAQQLESGSTSVLGFVGAHGLAFVWGGVAVAAIALGAWVDSLGGLLWTVALTAVWVAGVLWVRRRYAAAPSDGAPPALPPA